MLAIEELEVGYGDARVLHGVSLGVAAHEIVALIGANGSGKTTLARALAGLLPVESGRILLDGAPIERLSPRARLGRGMAQVPEGRQIVFGLTVRETLRLGAYTQRYRLGERGLAERTAEVCQYFPALLECCDALAGNLSGGQQQMLAIARALMVKPRLLVFDEPSLGLAPVLVTEIFRLIAGLRKDGLAILLSEQNARLSLAIADRAYVIENGRVALEGTGAALLRNPEVAERYLGVGKGAASAGAGSDGRHAALVHGLTRILGAGAGR